MRWPAAGTNCPKKRSSCTPCETPPPLARINCTGPGVTETPILDQLRTAYGQAFLDDIPKPLGRVAGPAEQSSVLLFLNSRAASYITGQVLWVDGGNVGAAIAHELLEGQEGAPWPA